MTNKQQLLADDYLQRIVKYEARLLGVEKSIKRISYLRLFLFVFTFALLIYLFRLNPNWFVYIALIAIVVFLIILKIHSKLFQDKEILINLIEINSNEIEALKGNVSNFESGNKFIVLDDQKLHFAIDLDVFGKESLYQHLNRTTTIGGAKLLADGLKFPEKNVDIILNRQEAIKELAEKIDFRHRFLAFGKSVQEVENEYQQILDWLGHESAFSPRWLIYSMSICLPVLNTALLVLSALNFIDYSFLGFSLLISLLFVAFWQKSINALHRMVSKKVRILEKYEQLLILIERENYVSSELQDLKNKLSKNKQSSSSIIRKLASILSALDNRLNILVGVLLNAFFLWDLQQIIRLEKWKKSYADQLEVWFLSISKIDALISFSTFAYNHPDYNFPSFNRAYFSLNAVELRNPLMSFNDCIPNDFEIQSAGKFKIITGANMAGKSTFLRSLGVNMLLGMQGTNCAARELVYTPVELLSSLRTTDSLTKNISYFYAEIKRLEYIILQIKNGVHGLVLLDEILKGTNSADKEQGSKALLEQLLNLKTSGIIATHDINLTTLDTIYGDAIESFCFEVEVKNDELLFDYKLRSGTVKNLSATFLMRKLGIIKQ